MNQDNFVIVKRDSGIELFEDIDYFLTQLCKEIPYYRGKCKFSEQINLVAYQVYLNDLKDDRSFDLSDLEVILSCTKEYGWQIIDEIQSKLSAIACCLETPCN